MNSPFDLHGRSAGARDWSAMALGASPSTIEKTIVSWGAGLAEPALPRLSAEPLGPTQSKRGPMLRQDGNPVLCLLNSLG
jgi:hypothetical protein